MINEKDFNSFDSGVRKAALAEFAAGHKAKKQVKAYNLHCHTFFSYNGYGYSPSRIAAIAAESGWFAAGIVDFDVLDACDEFIAAAKLLNLRGVCGIETRTFISGLAKVEINSPGEPGIAYHMGMGFTSSSVPTSQKAFADDLKRKAAERTAGIVKLVNGYLKPVVLDFKADVLTLTPAGNATERHVCTAYRAKAECVFPDAAKRAAFWGEKLSLSVDEALKTQADPVKLEALIRSKTMKQGGVGYVPATPDSFPTVESMNSFIIACGAVPTVAWLNGLSGGEADPGALLDLHISKGAAILNIIPDRNWNYSDEAKRKKMVHELDRMMDAAAKRDMPVVIGTEMNAPGQKLVDDFECDALAKYTDRFIEGAAILYAHTILTQSGRGYVSEWAKRSFKDTAEKNRFFSRLGN